MQKILTLILVFFLTGCASADIERYAAATPEFDAREFLNGAVEGEGIVFNRWGAIESRFKLDMVASWEGENGVMKEHYVYDNGRLNDREMRLRFVSDNDYIMTGADVIGEGSGSQSGNIAHTSYVLRLPVKDRTYDVACDDWIYQLTEEMMLNRITLSKFGVRVGEVWIVFRKKT